jgi:redox-sensitive bicupin YhaK (pirin superfamily)
VRPKAIKPIVMNTQAELRQAVSELNDGTFIRAA